MLLGRLKHGTISIMGYRQCEWKKWGGTWSKKRNRLNSEYCNIKSIQSKNKKHNKMDKHKNSSIQLLVTINEMTVGRSTGPNKCTEPSTGSESHHGEIMDPCQVAVWRS